MTVKTLSIVLLVLLVVDITPAMIYIPGVPVNSMTLYQLQVACNMLQNDLNRNPSLPRSSGYKLYSDTYLANYFLQKVANDPGIASYNNVIYGAGNSVVKGNKNIIFGHGNTVANGSNNYVFSQNFDSSQVNTSTNQNNLVLDNWLIELLKIYLIPFQPSQAIQKWA